METSSCEPGGRPPSSKKVLAETPAGANAAPHMVSHVGGLDCGGSPNPCLSPRRLRSRGACKPSPARNAAAVILATLLGGQGQPQESCPNTKAGKSTGVAITSAESKKVSATNSRAKKLDKMGCETSELDDDTIERTQERCLVDAVSWLDDESGRTKRPRAEAAADSDDWGLSPVPHPGQESRRFAQWQREALRSGRELEGSPRRDRGAGTPASAAIVRRPSPRKRAAIRRVGREERRAGFDKREGFLEDVGTGRTPPSKAATLGNPLAQTTSNTPRVCHRDRDAHRMGSANADGADQSDSGQSPCSPEGGAAGGGAGSGDESSYSGYCRKDKSLGLLCGRFVEVYGRQQHLKPTVNNKKDAKATGAAAHASTVRAEGTAEGTAEGMVELDRAAVELGVARRRIYDVINILESLCVVSRARKNTYRWHGQSNLVSTLRQLQRTAALVFPDEVVKNDMAECLRQKHKEKRDESAPRTPSGEAEAAVSLGAPRPDGQKEKSLGGLCRRFVQLFLVGNDVVSVAAAAEKLSDPEDVATANVVYKTRARRLYDIANALAALGLVEKVRSRESQKPNFRWVGVPVRKLPQHAEASSDFTAAHQQQEAEGAAGGGAGGAPSEDGTEAFLNPSPRSPQAGVKRRSCGRDGARNRSPASFSKSRASAEQRPPDPDAPDASGAPDGEQRSQALGLSASAVTPKAVTREGSMRSRSPGKRSGPRSITEGDVGGCSGNKRRQGLSPLIVGQAESARKAARGGKNPSVQAGNVSPYVVSAKRACPTLRLASPTAMRSRDAAAASASGDDYSPDAPSDQGSPVDPRKVMRHFPDCDGADEDGDDERRGRVSDGHEEDGVADDVTDENCGYHAIDAREGTSERYVGGDESDAASRAMRPRAARRRTPSGPRARARASASSCGEATARFAEGERREWSSAADTPGPASRASPSRRHSGFWSAARLELARESWPSSESSAEAKDGKNPAACPRALVDESHRQACACCCNTKAMAAACFSCPPPRVGELEATFKAETPPADLRQPREDLRDGVSASDEGGVGSCCRRVEESAVRDGDGSDRKRSLVEDGEGVAHAIPVLEKGQARTQEPPESPGAVRLRQLELLNIYMKEYTDQWNRWREAGPESGVPPPHFPYKPPYTLPSSSSLSSSSSSSDGVSPSVN